MTLLQNLRRPTYFPAESPLVPGRFLTEDELDAVVALVEAAQRCRAEMFRHREDVWCGDYEAALDELRAALAAFTEDKQGRIPS